MLRTANIYNLQLVRTAAERLGGRTTGLPGLAVLYGPAGWGKTTAAGAVGQERRAYFVQIRSAWTRKALLEKILDEMSIKARGTVSDMLDMVATQLASSGRLLILDEFDYAAAKEAMVELVRDIYEASQSTILLIGEESLPTRLKRYERFHSRVLTWVAAQAVSVADAEALAPIYAPDITIGTDLLEHIVSISSGSVRRVSVNLSLIAETAALEGWERVTRGDWGRRELYTGEAPRRAA